MAKNPFDPKELERMIEQGRQALERSQRILSGHAPPNESPSPAAEQAFSSVPAEPATAPTPRLSSMIESPSAARKMEAHIKRAGIGQTEFAIAAGTTDRTLRAFRKTGKVRRDIFSGIARAMGTTKEDLLKQ